MKAWDDLIDLIHSLSQCSLWETHFSYGWSVTIHCEASFWSVYVSRFLSSSVMLKSRWVFISYQKKSTSATNYLLLCGSLHLSLSQCWRSQALVCRLLMGQRRIINLSFCVTTALFSKTTRAFIHTLMLSWWIMHRGLWTNSDLLYNWNS